MGVIATVTGTAIRPGISKNNRLYTADAIGKMVARAQARIADGGMPLTTMTHHDAGDDSTRIVGRITSLTQEADGSAKYTAVLADTSHARDIHGLISGPSPALKGVSIRGAWVGPVRRVQHDGRMVETADDLELSGLDYTHKPGVEGAVIDSVDPVPAMPRESDGSVLVPITESAPEATVVLSEADTPAVSKRTSGLSDDSGRKYADGGYQKDGKQRYDITTKAKAKAAWSYINQADNARLYTSAQLKRVKQRIVKALKGFGVTVATQEGWLIDPATAVTESLAECWDMSSEQGALYISLTNGPTTVTVSSTLMDAHDLELVGRAAMAGACDALLALDPDMDADIDVPGAEPEDTDDGMDGDDEATAAGAPCPCGCGCAIPEHPGLCPCACSAGQCVHCMGVGEPQMETAPTPQDPAPDSAAATTEEEAPMAETTTPAAETPGTDGVAALGEKIDTLTNALAGFITAMTPKAPVEAAPAAPAPVAEAAPVVTESEDDRIARLVKEGIAAALPQAVQEHVETSGGPARKGLVAPVTETAAGQGVPGMPEGAPAKPLHEYTDEEWRQHMAPVTVSAILGSRGQAAQ